MDEQLLFFNIQFIRSAAIFRNFHYISGDSNFICNPFRNVITQLIEIEFQTLKTSLRNVAHMEIWLLALPDVLRIVFFFLELEVPDMEDFIHTVKLFFLCTGILVVFIFNGRSFITRFALFLLQVFIICSICMLFNICSIFRLIFPWWFHLNISHLKYFIFTWNKYNRF